MELDTLTERQLASLLKSKNYIPPAARNRENVLELRTARKQAKRDSTIQRKAALEARRIVELDTIESKVSKDLDKINNDSKSLKVVIDMQLLMNFILANPQFLDLLDEFNKEFIPYLISTRNKINMVLKLNNERKRTYKQKKEIKRYRFARRSYLINSDLEY